jgi:hypothetical protein
MPVNAYVGTATIPAGWPDETNTGVPGGTSLTPSGSFTASTPGATYDALHVTGNIEVTAANVTIKRCLVEGSIGFISSITASNVLVQDTEVDGGGNYGHGMHLGDDATVERCYIHGWGNGFNVSGDGVSVTDSYIYDLYPGAPPGDEHADGFEVQNGTSGTTIDHCHIYPLTAFGTSCINIYNESDGTVSNVTINNNLINGDGCSFCIYFPRYSGWSNVVCTNNRMVPAHPEGPDRYCDSSVNTTTFSGNVDHETGNPISTGD